MHELTLGLERGRKSLHNNENIRLFEVIGLSKKPISGKKIVNLMKAGSSGRYLYERINQLTPQTDEDIGVHLFCIEDEFTIEKCQMIVKKLKESFPNILQFGEFKSFYPRVMKRSKNIKAFEIQDNADNQIKIKLQRNKNSAIVTAKLLNGRKKIPLIIKRKNGLSHVYTVKIVERQRRMFLAISFNNSIVKKLMKAKTSTGFEKIRSAAQSNRRYWDYSLNSRSLLVYCSGQRNLRIVDKVISNLSRSYLNNIEINFSSGIRKRHNFRFLNNYYKWKTILPRHFLPRIIRSVGIYIKDSIQSINFEDLDYLVAREIYNGIIGYIFSIYQNTKQILTSISGRAISEYIVSQSEYLNRYDRSKVNERSLIIDDCFKLLGKTQKDL